MTTATEVLAPNESAGDPRGAARSALDYVGGLAAAGAGKVRSAVAKSGELAGTGLYKGSYGASYGVVFGAVFVKELLPTGNALRRGFEDGSEAAFDAVEARKAAPRAGEEPKPAKARASRKSAA